MKGLRWLLVTHLLTYIKYHMKVSCLISFHFMNQVMNRSNFVKTLPRILNIHFHASYFFQEFCQPADWNIPYFKYFTTRDCMTKTVLSLCHVSTTESIDCCFVMHGTDWPNNRCAWRNYNRKPAENYSCLEMYQPVIKKAPMDNKTHCLFFHLCIDFIKRIGTRLHLKCWIFKNSMQLYAVRSAATSGKLYRLLVDKENAVLSAEHNTNIYLTIAQNSDIIKFFSTTTRTYSSLAKKNLTAPAP